MSKRSVAGGQSSQVPVIATCLKVLLPNLLNTWGYPSPIGSRCILGPVILKEFRWGAESDRQGDPGDGVNESD